MKFSPTQKSRTRWDKNHWTKIPSSKMSRSLLLQTVIYLGCFTSSPSSSSRFQQCQNWNSIRLNHQSKHNSIIIFYVSSSNYSSRRFQRTQHKIIKDTKTFPALNSYCIDFIWRVWLYAFCKCNFICLVKKFRWLIARRRILISFCRLSMTTCTEERRRREESEKVSGYLGSCVIFKTYTH